MSDLGPWAFGPWCWLLDEVIPLEIPIPCKGMPGIWPLGAPPLPSVGSKSSLERLAGAGVQLAGGLSLQQPYASAIAIGPKRVENRTWRRKVPPGGMWLALHAASTFYPGGEDLIAAWRFHGPGVPGDDQVGLWLDAPAHREGYPTSGIIAVIRVRDIVAFGGGQ